MKFLDKHDATRPLADYAAEIREGTIVVTEDGLPMAALVPLTNADSETVSLSTNPEFLKLMERSRAQLREGEGVSSDDMRSRFD